MQTADALERTAYELCVDSAEDGIDYLEVRWAPLLHLRAGLQPAEVIEAVLRGLAAGPIRAVAIVCAMRPHPVADNVALARLAVARRAGGGDGAEVLDAVEDLAPPEGRRAGETDGAGGDVVFLDMAPVEASSTLARELIAAGEPTGGLLAPAVREYIDRHGLYRARPPGAEAQR